MHGNLLERAQIVAQKGLKVKSDRQISRRIAPATSALRERRGLPARWHALEHGRQQPEPPGDLVIDLSGKRIHVLYRRIVGV